jgi:tetraprenyl-beta-curcumene synthase
VSAHASMPRTRIRPVESAAAMRALASSNLRYWPSVAPVVAGELACWREAAQRIEDSGLRALAVRKLNEEHFNAQVAATLATLAPRPARATAVRAIVALELMFDYLDGRTEPPYDDPLDEAGRLFGAFTGAISGGPTPTPDAATAKAGTSGAASANPWQSPEPHEQTPDWPYLQTLARRAREQFRQLPATPRIAAVARASAERCAQAQTLLHASAAFGDGPLREWAQARAPATGLAWREYAAGSASSVIAVHALIAAAANPRTSTGDALQIDAAYLAIGAVITLLDCIVDASIDSARGEPGFGRLYDDREQLAGGLLELTREALRRAEQAPCGAHHVMTLAGVIAYYTTHPGAREAHARDLLAAVRRELSPTVWPALALMHTWRAAKRIDARLVHHGERGS